MSDYVSKKVILNILQLETEAGDLIPAVKDVEEHDITSSFVAGLLYVVFDRYLSTIPDSEQKAFKDRTIKWFYEMLKDDKGSEYIEMINPKDLD